MSLKKYTIATLLGYTLIFFSPIIAIPLNLTAQQSITLTAGSYFLGAGLLLFFNNRLKEVPPIEKKSGNFPISKVILWGLLGIPLAFFAQTFANLLEQLLFHTVPESENTQNIVELIKTAPIFMIAVSIAGPIMEEFVFRKAITGFLSKYISSLLAGITSSFLFALAHADGHILVYFAMGMTFYYLYQKTGSIWTSIVTHCCMNGLVMLLQLSILQ